MTERLSWSQLKRKLGAKDRKQAIKLLQGKGTILASWDGLNIIEWREQ